jgi:hypothetical protein
MSALHCTVLSQREASAPRFLLFGFCCIPGSAARSEWRIRGGTAVYTIHNTQHIISRERERRKNRGSERLGSQTAHGIFLYMYTHCTFCNFTRMRIPLQPIVYNHQTTLLQCSAACYGKIASNGKGCAYSPAQAQAAHWRGKDGVGTHGNGRHT